MRYESINNMIRTHRHACNTISELQHMDAHCHIKKMAFIKIDIFYINTHKNNSNKQQQTRTDLNRWRHQKQRT